MNPILTNFLNENFNKEFKWRIAVLNFSLYGAFSYYYLTNEALLKLEGVSIVKVLTILTVGFLFGNITSFLFAFLLKLTARLFQIQSSYIDIVKTLSIAYKPHLITCLLIICRIIISPDPKVRLAPDSIGLLVFFLVIINILTAIFGTISIILLVKGLMKVQNLTLGKTVIYYLIASVVLSPIYFLLIRL
jgi:hypothetical protein